MDLNITGSGTTMETTLLDMGFVVPEQIDIITRQLRRMQSLGIDIDFERLVLMNGFISSRNFQKALERHQRESTGETVELEAGAIINNVLDYALRRRLGVTVLRREGPLLHVAAVRTLTDREKVELLEAVQRFIPDVTDIVHAPQDKILTLQQLNQERHVSEESLARLIDRLNADPGDGQTLQGIVRDIMVEAVQSRASDIHIDKVEDPLNSWICYRIDGVLHYRFLMNPEAVKPLVTRFKDLSGMDMSESRKPQDGRFSFSFTGRKIDVRVATMPIDGGEALCMRLLDANNLLSLEEMFQDSPEILKRVKEFAAIKEKRGGLVILSGPTGSGKSTTLYAVLKELGRHRLNIMTAEDPVEYRLPLLRQSQVNPEAGATFASLLRAQLRQDPDILVVGEMRDAETAEIATRSVESGHFVFSTLHSVDALQTMERLSGLFPPEYKGSGVYVVCHYLQRVINQRLVLRLNPEFRQAVKIRDLMDDFGSLFTFLEMSEDDTVYIPSPDAGDRAYKGRVLLAEAMFIPPDMHIREQVTRALQMNNVADVFRMPEVFLQTRADSAASMLRRGLIDPATAIRAVDYDKSAAEAQLAARRSGS